MHQLHKRLTGAANSSIEIIIAWSELLQMRKRLFVRNWIRRLLRYLCIPVGFFLVVVPLYSLMIRQTIQAQSSSTMEMLAIGTTQLERCLSNIRSTTNKLFSETEYTLLASSDIVNIGLHFFLKNVRPYAASCSEAQYCCRLTIGGSPPLAEQILRLFQQLMKYLQMSVFNCSTVIEVGS